MATPTTQERNAVVLAVLKAEGRPIGPTAIARKINQNWCLGPNRPDGPRFLPLSSAIIPVLRRIGAVNHGGKWALE